MAQKLTDSQWGDVRTQWIATDRSVRDLAREFGVSAPAILKRASKEAWGPRNAPERKRSLVSSAAAGLRPGLHCKPRNEPEKAILDEAERDIAVMDSAARVAEKALARCEELIENETDPKGIKVIVESAKLSLETYRKARSLDEPSTREQVSPYANLSDEELEAELRRAGNG